MSLDDLCRLGTYGICTLSDNTDRGVGWSERIKYRGCLEKSKHMTHNRVKQENTLVGIERVNETK